MNRYLETLPPWVFSLTVLLGMVVLGLIVHWVAFSLARRIAERTRRLSDDFLVKRARAPTGWLIPLLLVSLVLPDLPLPVHVMDPVQRFVAIGFIAGVAW